ncbi:glycosyltransferase [Sphingomonas sp.]|uniref:glycosyltransferase n=1 Tax=Sphingomonas sp. TaxID=28214 RepID=UPI003B00119C
MTAAALLSLGIWLGLLAFRNGFWLARDTDLAPAPAPPRWPAVTAVIPARDEAAVISASLRSVLAQAYPGELRVVLVDDHSTDGTAAIARDAAGDDPRLSIVPSRPLPAGWTGKLWAIDTGVHAAGATDWWWFTDADIAHAPDVLASLVARGEGERLTLVSLMARLATDTAAERAIIPAFVLFFQMLYPFARVNRPGGTAAAAGGCALVRADAFARAGGMAAIAGRIIDDCALGALMKRQGAIRLMLTRRSRSIRSYGGWRGVFDMIARSAYAQLGYSPLVLAGTIAALALTFAGPPLAALAGGGAARAAGLAAWGLMAVAALPILRFYRQSPLWALAMPAIGVFYGASTFWSAVRHNRGRGGMWKGRAQAGMGRA